MHRLILKLTLFIISITIANFGIGVLYTLRNSHSYNAAIIDKMDLLEQTSSPRLILLGGSGTAFGMQSAQLEDEFGIRVVNLSLQGGLGLRVLLGMVAPQVEAGDIILIVPEYYQFWMDGNGTGVVLQTLLSAPQLFGTQNTMQQWIALIRNLLPVHTDATQHMIEDIFTHNCFECTELADTVYQRNAFNSYGDINPELLQENPEFRDRGIWPEGEDDVNQIPEFWSAVNLLNDFADNCAIRGAQVLLIYPPLRSQNYEAVRNPLFSLSQTLPNVLHFPVLGSPERYLFLDAEIYDTPYHLNTRGAEHRTLLLIEDLQGIFNP